MVIISGSAHVLSANRTLILRKRDDAVYEALSMEIVDAARFAYFIVLGELVATDWAFINVIVLLDVAEWDQAEKPRQFGPQSLNSVPFSLYPIPFPVFPNGMSHDQHHSNHRHNDLDHHHQIFVRHEVDQRQKNYDHNVTDSDLHQIYRLDLQWISDCGLNGLDHEI